MQWKYERRLIFSASEKWAGWLCERCCWNRPLPRSQSEREGFGPRVGREFDSHDCKAFANENLHSSSDESASKRQA
jgi:hypothetical protein